MSTPPSAPAGRPAGADGVAFYTERDMSAKFEDEPSGGDSVDAMLRQSRLQWPELDVSSMAVIGRLLRAARLTEEVLADRLRRREGRTIANVGDMDLLLALRRAAPSYALTPGQLMRSLIVSSAGLSGRLNRLEREGWITRTISPEDRRSTRVSLTEQALAELDTRIEALFALERELVSVLEPDERATVARALRKLLLSLESAP
ncbi:MarR family transcriptional regulator [Streptomyces chromofuscus]|nr:MarR family transcriptional regulator [Streptomyces chromofuscus]